MKGLMLCFVGLAITAYSLEQMSPVALEALLNGIKAVCPTITIVLIAVIVFATRKA